MTGSKAWARADTAAIAGFAALAILFSWPLLLHLQTHLPGSPDGDAGVYVWNLWVFQHEILDHRTLPYFTGKIFASSGRANLSLHNYTAFANVLALPFVRWLGVVATFNLVYLFLQIVTAHAVYLLGKRVTRDAAASWLAGALFAWSPAMVTRGMGHYSLVAAAPLAIFVLLLMRFDERRSARDAAGIGATVAWATACDLYYGVFCVMLAGAYLVANSVHLIRATRTATRTTVIATRAIDLIAICVAGLVVALLVSRGWQFSFLGRAIRVRTVYTPLLALTILLAMRAVMAYRPAISVSPLERLSTSLRILATAALVSVVLMSPLLYAVGVRVIEDRFDRPSIFWRSSPPGIDTAALIVPNPNHPLAPASLRHRVAGLTRDGYLENVASIPLIALIVLVAGWRIGWRPPAFPAAIAIGFGVLALGPFIRIAGIDTHIPAPWSFLRYLPIVGLARSPGRFLIFALIGVAILFASALSALFARWPGARRRLLVSIAAILLFELLPAPRTIFSAEIPSIYRIVAADPRDYVRVLELPFGIRDGTMAVGDYSSKAQYYQTAHGKPIIGGYLSRVSRRRVREAERDPVLGSLIRLSEKKPLTADERQQLQQQWPEFAARTSLGYVVLDRGRASGELAALATSVLDLEGVAEDGSFLLLRPIAH